MTIFNGLVELGENHLSPYAFFYLLEQVAPAVGLLFLAIGALSIAKAVEMSRVGQVNPSSAWAGAGIGLGAGGALLLWLAYSWAAQPMMPMRLIDAYLNAPLCVQSHVDANTESKYELSLLEWRTIERRCQK